MLSLLQRSASLPAASWILFGVPALLLAVATVRKVFRREWSKAAIFIVVASGWLFRASLEIPSAPFSPERLPEELYIPQPTTMDLHGACLMLIGQRWVLRAEPPSQMAWNLDGREREISFEYGYVPEAYEKGNTNGAEFIIEISEGAVTRRVFQRLLNPVAQAADRAHQFSRVVLPPYQAGAQLHLRLGPGGATDWDWLYLRNVKFRRSGHFLPSQFPTFNPVPDRADSPLAWLSQQNGVATFLELHAPSHLEYDLNGSERRLAFSYGFLPGAHQKGGNTDGAVFRVELEVKNELRRLLFERSLQPVLVQADRGRQYLDLPLPAAGAGTRLILTIGAGPAGSNSWDWTYISGLTLE
jgi:hypothetical protein